MMKAEQDHITNPPYVEANGNRYWHVGREIPIALIITIAVAFLGQTVAAVWWVALTSSRIEQLERKMEFAAPQAERIIRLEEKLGWVQQGIAEIKLLISRNQAPR